MEKGSRTRQSKLPFPLLSSPHYFRQETETQRLRTILPKRQKAQSRQLYETTSVEVIRFPIASLASSYQRPRDKLHRRQLLTTPGVVSVTWQTLSLELTGLPRLCFRLGLLLAPAAPICEQSSLYHAEEALQEGC